VSSTLEAPKDARIDLRLPAEARSLVDEAAAIAGTTRSDYILSKVLPAARRDIAEAHTLRLSKQAWDDFLAILDSPDDERLAALRAHTPRWNEPRR
jgi:uncharacterized protein (DUF1778 family)